MKAPTRLLRLWLGFCLRTTSWQILGSHEGRTIMTSNVTGQLIVFWHRNLTLAPALAFWRQKFPPNPDMRVLISRNRDGRLIAEIVRPWGLKSIHGSSAKRSEAEIREGLPGKDKGGRAAVRSALRALSERAMVIITPDGPRGPAEHLHPGATAISRLTRCAIVPVGIASTNPSLPTWDRLAFPLPFQRGTIVIGHPLYQPDTTTLRKALNATNREAQTRLTRAKPTIHDRIWGLTGLLAMPALRLMAQIRIRRGRELRDRTPERRGLGPVQRPKGLLVWVHAASVGETLSAIPLLDALLESRPDLHILFTTATVTGGEIISRHAEAGARIVHRFIPYDVGRWVGRFLRRWSPDGAVFIESELWPGIIAQCGRRAIPMMLVNARLSDRSARRWRRFPSIASTMLGRLDWIAARGSEDAQHFRALGARSVFEDGDLKQDAPPLAYDTDALATLRTIIGTRPVFLAASTHPGEEEIVVAAATRARNYQPDLLTIIVPRHPTRGAALAEAFAAPARSTGALPDATTTVWIADTLGELGLFYRLADRVFLGNSLCLPGGGHNPFEPLRVGAPTAVGPHMNNWREAMALLHERIHTVPNGDALADWICAPDMQESAIGAIRQSIVPTLCARILATVDP